MLCCSLRHPAPAQLTLCGQTPETTLTAALASVNFYCGQQELSAQLRQSQLQRKIEKVQEACKKKLQEVHNGYTQARTGLLQRLCVGGLDACYPIRQNQPRPLTLRGLSHAAC
jgi:hypothetical protein